MGEEVRHCNFRVQRGENKKRRKKEKEKMSIKKKEKIYV
jgi:hypothetical protein